LGGKRRWAIAVAAAIVGAAIAASSAEAGIDVQIVNQTGRPDRSLYVMLSGGSSIDGRLPDNAPVRLSDLVERRFTLSSISGGRIYFSFGSPVNDAEPPAAPIRYDKVELTYPGVANLTAVDFFAIPFRLQTLNARGRVQGTLGYSAPTNTIVQALLRIPGARRALVRTAGGQFARVLSPQLSPTSYPSFRPCVDSLAGRRVVVRGAFFGTPFQTFTYAGTFASDGSITLTGTITPSGGHPAPGQALSVAGPALAPAVYTADGPYKWGGAVHHVSDNDVYAVIYRDLIAGFAWGYWGGRYGDDERGWTGKPPFEAARSAPARYATYNQYAAVIYRYSDAYGFSFSDTGPKKVQLPLGAPTLRITILADQRGRR
jgi:Beta-1,3-glucanase